MTYQWFSGSRHAKVGIDHNLITLGYSFLRQFCQEIAKTEIPEKDRVSVLEGIDKMVDFCLLIETQAFISATIQCDIEVVRGISHQVRNPLMIIGGNVNRLKRNGQANDRAHEIYDDILEESKRLENMVKDVNVYSEMFQKEPEFSESNLEELIAGPLMKLQRERATERPEIVLNLSPDASLVKGDREGLETMFFYLLENSLEAADPETPLIEISSRPWSSATPFIEVEVFNNGETPSMEDVADLFVPFYSSKPYGTGFGLAIAQLAARKSLGDLHLEPVQDKGLRCVIKLPASFKTNKEKGSVKK